jgi:tRNA(fMet)-specific endonuclease VapC
LEVSPILLDTSAYSAALQGEARMVHTVREADQISVNAVVLGELKAGFARGRHREKNEQELDRFLASPRVRVLELDEETSDRYAVILNSLRSSGTPIPTNDVWIAATAMQHGLRVVTTDQHFLKVRQILVDFLGKEIG